MGKGTILLSIAAVLIVATVFIFAPLGYSTRSLSASENEAALSLFGEGVNLEKVRIKSGGPLTWTGAAVTIGNVISFPRDSYDGAQEGQRQWLVHELTHVWQYQNHGLGYIPRSVWEQMTEEDAYAIQYDAEKSFLEYDIEEQAVMVAEYFQHKDPKYDPYIQEVRVGARDQQ